jgi:hypothetical protein
VLEEPGKNLRSSHYYSKELKELSPHETTGVRAKDLNNYGDGAFLGKLVMGDRATSSFPHQEVVE